MRRKLPIFYSALLLTGVNLLLRLVSTSFQVYISGRIGAAGVGLLQLVMSVGGLAMTAGMAGIRTAAMYLTAEELGKNRPQAISSVLRSCFCYSLCCSGAVAAALYAAAPLLAARWIGTPEVATAIRLLALFLPIVCLSGCMSGYFTATNRIGTLALVEIGEQLCYMAVTMAALILYAGADPAKACRCVVFGSGVSALFTLLCLLSLRRAERPGKSAPVPMASRLIGIALPLAAADVVKSGINTVETLMVPKRLALFAAVTAPLAAFGTVSGMVFPVLMFPAAILFALAELLIPEMARCRAAGSIRRIHYLSCRSLKIALLYGCLCAGLIFLLSDPLCLRLYKSPEAARQLRLYAALAPMLYCDAIVDAMNKGLGQQKISVRYNILTSAMDVAFLFVLLPRWGMMGYFFSFLVTHLVNFLLSLRLLSRTTGKVPALHTWALAAAASLAAVAGASKMVFPAGKIAAFLGLFAGLLLLFGIVGREDLRWLRSLAAKK